MELTSIRVEDYYQIRFDREIGRGLTGVVYEALNRSDAVEYAMKIIVRRNLTGNSYNLIKSEVSALQQLNHPNIVKMHAFFSDDENFYLCLDYIRGGEIFERIAKSSFYSERCAQKSCKDILNAIRHCHDFDIVHRDLKVENLLMTSTESDSDVVLVDFGFSEIASGLTLTGKVGTALYMAPEIWNDQQYGKPVDMWAFGVIAYILLSGYPPFYGSNKQVLMQLIVQGNYTFHDEFWGNISSEAKDFISCLLVTDMNKRMTADEAINHIWLTTEISSNNMVSTLVNLQHFNAKRKLRSAVDVILAVRRMQDAFMSRSNGAESDRRNVLRPSESDTNIEAFNNAVFTADKATHADKSEDPIDVAELVAISKRSMKRFFHEI